MIFGGEHSKRFLDVRENVAGCSRVVPFPFPESMDVLIPRSTRRIVVSPWGSDRRTGVRSTNSTEARRVVGHGQEISTTPMVLAPTYLNGNGDPRGSACS